MQKKRCHRYCLTLLALFASLGTAQNQPSSERLRRAESFLGIHFDFHANDDCAEIGKNVTPEMVAGIIDQVRPDYIQVDCKGHRGLSSYPTKVGNPAPGFVRDALKIFRDVTAEKGVALYCHYSGVLDAEAVKQHPEWAIQGADGKIGGADGRVTSVSGPYVTALLIPQLKELNDVYGIDGVWIDGECWGMERDFRPEVIQKFQKATGISPMPHFPDDPFWFEFSQFCREDFRQYVNHYVTELHAHNPNFQIASNWAYSSFMPEPVTLDVDFLSGDVVPTNSINSARLESRILAQQGKPWDLMAWSFTINWDDPGGFQSPKSVLQLQQEAAAVLSMGGGFQVYFQQNRDASVNLSDMSVMAEVAKFCRQRQPFVYQAVPVPQIGLILSTTAYYQKLKSLFQANHGELNGLKGILQILLESQNVVDVVLEQHLTENMQRYPLLIYPEWETITPEFKQQLIQYVENGGNLVVIGPVACQLFQDELGIELLDAPTENVNHLEFCGQIASIKSVSQRVKLADGVQPFGKIFNSRRQSDRWELAGAIRQLGKGRIAGVFLNSGARYLNGKVTVARDFLAGLVNNLFPAPLITLKGSHSVDVSLNRLNERLLVNLVNTAGPHDNPNVYVHDEILPLGPLQVTVRLAKKPARVAIRPSEQKLKVEYKNGLLSIIVPRLELHEILVIEE
jgi:hypothetical protein